MLTVGFLHWNFMCNCDIRNKLTILLSVINFKGIQLCLYLFAFDYILHCSRPRIPIARLQQTWKKLPRLGPRILLHVGSIAFGRNGYIMNIIINAFLHDIVVNIQVLTRFMPGKWKIWKWNWYRERKYLNCRGIGKLWIVSTSPNKRNISKYTPPIGKEATHKAEIKPTSGREVPSEKGNCLQEYFYVDLRQK